MKRDFLLYSQVMKRASGRFLLRSDKPAVLGVYISKPEDDFIPLEQMNNAML